MNSAAEKTIEVITTPEQARSAQRYGVGLTEGVFQHPDVVALFIAQQRQQQYLAAEHSTAMLTLTLNLRKEALALMAFMTGWAR